MKAFFFKHQILQSVTECLSQSVQQNGRQALLWTQGFLHAYILVKPDCECTYQMELFDTHFVYFGQVLPVSGLKMLVTSDRSYKW